METIGTAIGSTIVRTVLTNPILGTIGIQMTIQCLQTLASTTQEIYGFITTIKKTTSHVNIGTTLQKLDISADILVLESLLKEIDIEKHHTQTLAISLKILEDCMLDIHKLLEEVNQRIEYNNKLWITGYGVRTLKFDDISPRLEILASNLVKRKQNLIDIININPYLLPAPHIKNTIVEKDDYPLDVSIISIEKLITYEKDNN